MKKLAIITTAFALSACGNLATTLKPPAYKITDDEVQKLILEANKAEQCIHPEIAKANNDRAKLDKIYNSWVGEEKFLWGNIHQNLILPSIVGNEKYQKIANDPKSQQYLIEQHKKFNNSNPVEFTAKDKQDCKKFKASFNAQLKKLKDQTKKQIAAQKAQAKKDAEIAKARVREAKAREAYYRTPAGQAELARQQQERHHQEMMALQRQQMAQQQSAQDFMMLQQQIQQSNQQIQQYNRQTMQMIQSMQPQKVIVTPAYSGPSFPSNYGPSWTPVY